MTREVEFSGLDKLDELSREGVKSIASDFISKIKKLSIDFERLHVRVKRVHRREKSEKYEVHAKVIAGQPYTSCDTEYNVFTCLTNVLSKLQQEISV